MDCRYQRLKVIALNDSIQIYLCKDLETQEEVCMKRILIQDLGNSSKLLEELLSLYSIRSSPYFCKLISYHIEGVGCEFKSLCIITEYYPIGNLCNFLENTRKNNLVYSEEQLDRNIHELLNGYAILQKRDIFHRDVKPDNILVARDGSVKIADFGFSSNLSMKNLTIVGSPSYMSPEMRKRLLDFELTGSYSEEDFSPMLSDVWSLGVTFLYMITLKPQREFKDYTLLEETINNKINELQNPVYKELIRMMLLVDPHQRKDFIFLLNWFEEATGRSSSKKQNCNLTIFSGENMGVRAVSVPQLTRQISGKFPSIPSCKNCNISSGFIVCTSCKSLLHVPCLKDSFNKCSNCAKELNYGNLLLECKKCSSKFKGKHVNPRCLHRICIKCRAEETNCMHCFGFIFNEENRGDLSQVPKCDCSVCDQDMVVQGKDFVCESDNIRNCIVCKRRSHRGSCLLNNAKDKTTCIYCTKNIIKDRYSFFVDCKYCNRNYCSVCLKSISEQSHLNCSIVYCF